MLKWSGCHRSSPFEEQRMGKSDRNLFNVMRNEHCGGRVEIERDIAKPTHEILAPT
jgi:hypothetical protein